MSEAPISAPSNSRLDLVREPLLQLGLFAGAYLITAGAIYLFYLIGSLPGVNLPWFGLVGLILVTAAALGGVAWLTMRGDARAGTLGPIAVLLLVVALFAVADVARSEGGYSFWKVQTVRTLAAQTSMIAVAALGMTILIIAGGIDLSAGTNISLAATVLAWTLLRLHGYCQEEGWLAGDADPASKGWVVVGIVGAALCACVATGALAGLLNGFLVSQLQVVPFIVTLGTMSIFQGLNKFITGGNVLRPPTEVIPKALQAISSQSSDLGWLAYPLLPNVAWGVWMLLGLALLVGLLLEYSVLGRHLFAIGSNEATARLCGINTIFTKTLAYGLAGLFCGLAAIYLFGSTIEGSPAVGPGIELKVIAAVVIGGGSLSGGRGSVIGTLCGAALLPVIELGCTMQELNNQIQDVVIGAIIVGAVALDQVREGKIRLLQSVDRARELLHPLGALAFPLRWPLDSLADWLRRDGEAADEK